MEHGECQQTWRWQRVASRGAASYDGHRGEWDHGKMVKQETKDSCGVLKAQEPCNRKAWDLNLSSSQM